MCVGSEASEFDMQHYLGSSRVIRKRKTFAGQKPERLLLADDDYDDAMILRRGAGKLMQVRM
ncbi:hypothetical protein EJ03DRAFT_330597 [Teratosphaeria nubilosa]|uniref:Uncharacterized protein n=1 Tax=Teratosphaeria nubilosa TaxID=161662 RepID=A0A6G1KZX5_9PEZI|nr:hypothetical protein EJ03DRAFT_330597 [Teratosphaeria nubilosa]